MGRANLGAVRQHGPADEIPVNADGIYAVVFLHRIGNWESWGSIFRES